MKKFLILALLFITVSVSSCREERNDMDVEVETLENDVDDSEQ